MRRHAIRVSELCAGLFDNTLADYLWSRAVLLIGPTIATVALQLQVCRIFSCIRFIEPYDGMHVHVLIASPREMCCHSMLSISDMPQAVKSTFFCKRSPSLCMQ